MATTTPLLSDKAYGAIEIGESAAAAADTLGGYGLRKRTPKSNRPNAASNTAGGVKLPPRKVARQATGRGKAVLTSLMALEALHNHAKSGGAGGGGPARPSASAADHVPKHSWIYTLLNPRSNQLQARIFKHFIALVILADLTLYVVSTEPQYSVDGKKHDFFLITEGVTSSIFLVEYALRLATCIESKRFARHGPCLGRLRYMVTFPALIDAFATFPFWIERIFGVDLPTLTFLRAFRLLRILKTESFSTAMSAVARVLYYNREILWVAFLLCIFLVLMTAFLMYYLRPQDYDTGPDASNFDSIGATMYLSTLMLTGQGGPDGDLPWYTKAVVLLTGVFSIGMFAIPASMLTWGFEAEAERLAARAIQQARKRRAAGKDVDDSSTTSSSSSAYSGGWHHDSSSSLDTSDEEYQRVIAGDEEEEEDKMNAMFASADADHSGNLTKVEFLEMMEEMKASGGVGRHHRVGIGGSGSGVSMERIEKLESKIEKMDKKMDQLLEILSKK